MGAEASDTCNPGRGIERAERLEYLADMVLELKQLAERDGLTTLAAILALAHVEAMQQVTGRTRR